MNIGGDKKTLYFRLPNAVLSMRGTYNILMDSGVVLGFGCASDGPPSPGISSGSDWKFYAQGVCNENFYIGPPGFYNCIGKS